MNDNQLLRYSRHILLAELGIEGQERLLRSRALILGAGGLGSPIVLYLAAAGVGHITICDGDAVDLTNLQRQIAHASASIGKNKARSAAKAARSINPEIETVTVPRRVTESELQVLVRTADVVLDASDNFATRHAVNRACAVQRKPLVSGAAVRFDGQVSVFDLRESTSPCYHCLFPDSAEADEMRCAENGVFSPLVGIIGTTQAAEAIKLLAGVGRSLQGRLLLLNALEMEWRTIRVPKDSACPVCARQTKKTHAEQTRGGG